MNYERFNLLDSGNYLPMKANIENIDEIISSFPYIYRIVTQTYTGTAIVYVFTKCLKSGEGVFPQQDFDVETYCENINNSLIMMQIEHKIIYRSPNSSCYCLFQRNRIFLFEEEV